MGSHRGLRHYYHRMKNITLITFCVLLLAAGVFLEEKQSKLKSVSEADISHSVNSREVKSEKETKRKNLKKENKKKKLNRRKKKSISQNVNSKSKSKEQRGKN